MVAVNLKKSRSGWIYEFAGGDLGAFRDVTGDYWWIHASAFERTREILKKRYGITLTKKWYHVQRLRGITR